MVKKGKAFNERTKFILFYLLNSYLRKILVFSFFFILLLITGVLFFERNPIKYLYLNTLKYGILFKTIEIEIMRIVG